ncbi:MAG: acyclic terpene utilization AtuA family protein [Pseudomonadota bacterium]
MRTRVLVPSGALGLGWDAEAMARGIANSPDIIVIDGGSTDSGPHYLGTGTSKYSRQSTKVEWGGLMAARAEAGVPLVIGTAGTCGADSAVEWLLDITRELAAERGERLTVAVLKSGQSAEDLARALQAGRIAPLEPAPEISAESLAACTNIVALAGAEQIQAALATGADIVIAGRTSDAASIAALPLAQGAHAGAAWHGAKVGECGALCASNPQSGVVQLDFDEGGCTITPLADGAHATPATVSAHMLYENADPFHLKEPGGVLNVTGASYAALDDTSVRITGAAWEEGPYAVKLEGARQAGFQTVSLATIRDARYVKNVRAWCADIEAQCRAKAEARLGRSDFELELRIIGLDATLGESDGGARLGSEVGVMGIVTAESQALATEIAKFLNPFLLHHPLTKAEEQPTFAFPFSPPEMARGAVHEFCLNHVLALDEPMAGFRLEVEELGA